MSSNQQMTVLFDLDGTLIDSIDLIVASYRHTIALHLGEAPDESRFLAGLGIPLRTQLREFARSDDELVAMLETYKQHTLENHDRMIRRYPGMLDAIDVLRTRDMQLGIVTSKLNASAHRGLRACGFDVTHFQIIVGADDVLRHKPDPEPVLHAMRELNASPQNTIYIGDSPHDIAAGKAAGVATAAVGWGPFARSSLAASRPDFWVETPSELGGIPDWKGLPI